MELLVLIGTQTGNSELVADDVAEHLAEAGHVSHLVDLADAVPEMLPEHAQPDHAVIFVMCTWSEGTPPDNAKDFVDALGAVAPDLIGLRFGVIGLGDRDYDPYFCTATRELSALLCSLGAVEVMPALEIDGGPSPDHLDQARDWADAFAASLEAHPA